MLASHNTDDQARGRIHAIGVVVAAALASIAAWLRWLVVCHSLSDLASVLILTLTTPIAKQTTPTAYSPPPPPVSDTPTFETSFSLPTPTLSLLLPSAILLALTLILFDPLLSRALTAHFPAARQVNAGWPIAVVSTAFVGYVGFGQGASLAEAALGGLSWVGTCTFPPDAGEALLTRFAAITHLISSDPRSTMVSSSSSITTSASKTPFLARLSIIYRHFRSTIKTILATPDSRRIYFFLCLNLAYMVVQMLYGIWTNSLGLISDCERSLVAPGPERRTDSHPRSDPHVLRLPGAGNGSIRKCDGHVETK